MNFKELVREAIDKQGIDKGEFHKWCIRKGFIKSMNDKIPEKAISAGLKDDDEHVRRMAQFAKNMKEVR